MKKLSENIPRESSWTKYEDISNVVWDIWNILYQKLDAFSQSYEKLKQVQKENKWYVFRQDTLEYIFEKYP